MMRQSTGGGNAWSPMFGRGVWKWTVGFQVVISLKADADVTFQLYSQMGFLFILCLDSGFWEQRDNVCILSCFHPILQFCSSSFSHLSCVVIFTPGTYHVRMCLFLFVFPPFSFRNASEELGMAVFSFFVFLGNLFKNPSSLCVFVVGSRFW